MALKMGCTLVATVPNYNPILPRLIIIIIATKLHLPKVMQTESFFNAIHTV